MAAAATLCVANMVSNPSVNGYNRPETRYNRMQPAGNRNGL